MLGMLLKETNFDEIEQISIPDFFWEVYNLHDNICICNRVVTWLVSCIMTEPTFSSFKGLESPQKIRATGLHNEMLSLYVKVVNFLLSTYTTDNTNPRAMKELEFRW